MTARLLALADAPSAPQPPTLRGSAMPKLPKLYRDATTGQYTTAEDAAARPAETVAETVDARHETPDVAELRRLLAAYRAASGLAPIVDAWYEVARAAHAALPALLDADAERDRLARLLDEPRRSGCAVEIAGVRIAPCDERGQTADMRERDALLDRLAHMREARDAARAEVKRLTAKVERVRALADEWTYNGEFGWDDGSHAYGTDCVVQALDYAAAKLRRALDEEPQP